MTLFSVSTSRHRSPTPSPGRGVHRLREMAPGLRRRPVPPRPGRRSRPEAGCRGRRQRPPCDGTRGGELPRTDRATAHQPLRRGADDRARRRPDRLHHHLAPACYAPRSDRESDVVDPLRTGPAHSLRRRRRALARARRALRYPRARGAGRRHDGRAPGSGSLGPRDERRDLDRQCALNATRDRGEAPRGAATPTGVRGRVTPRSR